MTDRRAPRIIAAIGAIVKHGESSCACMTRTVSRTGAFLLTKTRWPPDAVLDLEMIRDEQRFTIQARVAFAADDGVAVAFLDPSPEFTSRFQSFLDQLVARRPEDDALAEELENVLTWKSDAERGMRSIRELFNGVAKHSTLVSLSLDGAAVDATRPPPVGDELLVSVLASPKGHVLPE
ncbi:MAG: PilZ domain-containing protein, partial [Myxococcota bacterium]